MVNNYIGKIPINALWIANNITNSHYFIECFSARYGIGAKRLLKQLVEDNFLSRIFVVNSYIYSQAKSCGYNINSQCEVLGLTALKSALRMGNFTMVKQIIEDGAELNHNSSPSEIYCAIDGGCIECLKILISAQNKKSIYQFKNSGALHYAITKNNLDMAKELIKSKAEVNEEITSIPGNQKIRPLDCNIFASDILYDNFRSCRDKTQAIRIIKLLKSSGATHSEWFLRLLEVSHRICPCCNMFTKKK